MSFIFKELPYETNPSFSKRVAYFSMEYAIDQCLKIYSGGLGFLSGSHLRSAFQLKQRLLGVGLLWKFGYYDQVRSEDQNMEVKFIEKTYNFLIDTGIIFSIKIHQTEVKIKAFYLPPNIFGTAPLFLLSTDIEENDYLSRTITHHLYDKNEATRVAQSMVLGIGGAKLLDILQFHPEVYHLNEGHGLPLAFYLWKKWGNIDEVKKRLVFTTHTPEKAGNEERNIALLKEMSFFGDVPEQDIHAITSGNPQLNYTLAALKLSKIANGVSTIHGHVSRNMWGNQDNICPIISITNAQDQKFWTDPSLAQAAKEHDYHLAGIRKYELKKELLKIVADQTGKIFNPDYLTLVWARRFAGYKRANLLLRDFDRFLKLVNNKSKPIQIIWAGKPYPFDEEGIHIFNQLVEVTSKLDNCTILTGYEMRLSEALKKGADVWLNTPRPPQEASGTSGMTAAMNGAINFSILDGWFPEFAVHAENSFVIQGGNRFTSTEKQDELDHINLMNVLEHEILPIYYEQHEKWGKIRMRSMQTVVPSFDSCRMASEYYEKLYQV